MSKVEKEWRKAHQIASMSKSRRLRRPTAVDTIMALPVRGSFCFVFSIRECPVFPTRGVRKPAVTANRQKAVQRLCNGVPARLHPQQASPLLQLGPECNVRASLAATGRLFPLRDRWDLVARRLSVCLLGV